MKHVFLLATTLLFVNCGSSSSSSETKGGPIGAPKVEPPLTRNTPSGFKSSGLLLDASSVAALLKGFLYPTTGFVGPAERLSKIDSRMTELDTRNQGGTPRKCLESTATAYSIGATLPGDSTFTLNFQCQETMAASAAAKEAQLGFGLDTSGAFSLLEHTILSDNSAITVMAKAPKDATSVEVWDLRMNAANTSYDALHILASDTAGTEVTTASSTIATSSSSFPCGLHMKSNSNFIYIKTQTAASGVCGADEIYCLKASSLASASSVADCTSAGLSTFSLTTLTNPKVASSAAAVKTIVSKKITGYIDFTEDALVTQ